MRIETPLYRKLAIVFAATAACVLAACGAEQVAGIEGSGAPVASAVTTTGRITGFGSVIVDGVEYTTSAAQVRIDDQPAVESELRVGQVVTIKGSVNANGTTGVASEVSLNSDARGAVAQVDVANGTFVVLGQTVRATDETLFDEGTQAHDISDLQTGIQVRVSGFANTAGELVASRIDGAPLRSSAELQVRGKVQSLDTSARSFRVNALTVDYSGATVSGTLSPGGIATVRGIALSAEGALVATQVTAAAAPAGKQNERGQVEGLITSFSSNSDFVVSDQRVAADSATEFVLNGLSLGADVFVKVRGTFNASGVLVASKVEAKVEAAQVSSGIARGVVTSVSSAAGTLSAVGVSASVSGSTAFEDRSNEHKRDFRLADLRVGDYVEVRGTAGTNGSLSATLVQRDKPESRSYLQGVALNVVEPSFTVLGVTVVTNSDTRFHGLDRGARTPAEFFSQATNQVVNVRGTLNGDTLVADQVRVEK